MKQQTKQEKKTSFTQIMVFALALAGVGIFENPVFKTASVAATILVFMFKEYLL